MLTNEIKSNTRIVNLSRYLLTFIYFRLRDRLASEAQECSSKLTEAFHTLNAYILIPQNALALSQFACEQGVGGLVYLLDQKPFIFQGAAKVKLQKTWLRQSGAWLARSQLLNTHWPYHLEPPLLIKGIDLEEALYRPLGLDLGSRACSDWDLLLTDPDYTELVTQWTNHFPPPLLPSSARFEDEDPHEMGFYIEGLLFELHKDPAPLTYTVLNGQDIWNRSHLNQSSWQQTIRQPSHNDRLLLWLINYAKSGGCTRILDWVDLTLILSAYPIKELQDIFQNPAKVKWLENYYLTPVMIDVTLILKSLPLWYLFPKEVRVPLCLAENNKSHFPRNIKRTPPLFTSLTKASNPILVTVQKLKYCVPHLRQGYLHRGLDRSYRSLFSSYPPPLHGENDENC